MKTRNISKWIILPLLLLLPSFVTAQTVDKEIEAMKREFETFRKKVNDEYNEFVKQVWKEYKLLKTGSGFTSPKPKVIPQADENQKPQKPEELFDKPIKPEIPVYKIPKDDFTGRRDNNFEKRLTEMSKQKRNHKLVDFYGAKFIFHYNNFDFDLYGVPNKKKIDNAVRILLNNKNDIKDAIYQWSNYGQIMQLNDYGLLQLIRKTGKTILQNENKVTLFTWFVLNKMGADIRIGSVNNEILLTTTSTVPLNNTVFSYLDNKKYYLLLFNAEQQKRVLNSNGYLKTYPNNLFQGDYTFNFMFENVPDIVKDIKRNRFVLNNRTVKPNNRNITIDYNYSYIDLLKDMPILDYPLYFHIPMSANGERSIKASLQPLLKNKNDIEKVNFLLNFVQYSFPYKLDKDNFGQIERPQAPEELLFYKYSDCEDHSALFAWLVNTFTDLEVMGILYRDHACTAVKFKHKVNGYHLPAPYQEYVICDATYIGAWAGMCMPQYIGVTPERVFKVKKR